MAVFSFVLVYGYVFFQALCLSLILVPLVRKYALAKNIVAQPKKDRHHTVSTPLLGGVAIMVTFYVVVIGNILCVKKGLPIINLLAEDFLPYSLGAMQNLGKLMVVLIGGLMIFSLGLVDDLRSIGPKKKLIFEMLVGVLLYANGIKITAFISHDVINMVVTVLWVVAITNAFNLLDNIDGLAAGVAVVAATILLLMCLLGGQVLIALLLLTFIGAVLGFLKYNFSPATIFMGDCGSLFIGFMMSAFMIMSTFYYADKPSIVPLAAPLMILSVPIYDTLSVIMIRLRNKRSPFVGDKNHFSHRLLRVGMNTRQAVSFIMLVGLCTGLGALSLVATDIISQVILLAQSVLLILLLHFLKSFKTDKTPS